MSDLLSEREMGHLESELDSIVNEAYGMSMGAIWCQVDDSFTFVKRKSAFIYVIRRLLEKGRVRLGRKGKLLEGDAASLVCLLDGNWPLESEFDDNQFCTVIPYEVAGSVGLHTHYWTPGDLVWVNEAGGEVWSTDAEQ
ncbi:DUF596 domain-containing protein [Ralstonia syzygii]|nr:DUF596 domain-containing protein [Ralstonia syzygii]